MAIRKRSIKKNTKFKVDFRLKAKTKGAIKNIIFSAQGFSLILVIASIATCFILFRMKGVEHDYEMSTLNKKLKKVESFNKDLRAKRAHHLSIKNLRKLAKKHKLKEPKQSQIIVIP